MKKFFTISEFAKLRNLDINSLRYYEKLGLLTPSAVNRETGYRYYSPEQLAVIDCITLCIQLGVPLKKLKSYIDGDGEFMIEKFYRDGKEQLGKKLDELRAKLQVVEHSVSNIEDNLLYTPSCRPISPKRSHSSAGASTQYCAETASGQRTLKVPSAF